MNDIPNTLRVGSAGILIEEGKLMMGLSNKWNKWVIPGGAVKFTESYKDAVVREIREETGLEVVWEKMVDVFEFIFAPDNYAQDRAHRLIIYSNIRRVGGSINPGDDIAEVAFFDRTEIADLYHQGLLTSVMHEVLTRFGWLDSTITTPKAA
jgi:ADP-ribose pyrophosphatase YjhB (NUDIX family)